jgi:hypothetical protein
MWQEWIDAVYNIEDPDVVCKLGIRTYKEFMGERYLSSGSNSYAVIRSFARLLHYTFGRITMDELYDIRSNLEGKGQFTESGIW